MTQPLVEKLLARRIKRTRQRVETIVRSLYGVKWFQPTVEDEIRLFRLAQWEEHFRLPIETQLQVLIPIWRQKFSKYSRHKGGLGTTVATLTGKKSLEILQEYIAKQQGEHLKLAWATDEQSVQIFAMELQLVEEVVEDTDVWARPTFAIKKYQEEMKLKREKRAEWARELAKRNYRGNPWRQE